MTKEFKRIPGCEIKEEEKKWEVKKTWFAPLCGWERTENLPLFLFSDYFSSSAEINRLAKFIFSWNVHLGEFHLPILDWWYLRRPNFFKDLIVHCAYYRRASFYSFTADKKCIFLRRMPKKSCSWVRKKIFMCAQTSIESVHRFNLVSH